MIKVIISVVIISLLGVSFRSSSFPFNENYWECSLGDSLLISGHVSKADSIVALHRNQLKHERIINFHLMLDAPSGRELTTSLFLLTANGAKILVSEVEATSIDGFFRLSRLKQIADSTGANALELQCLFDGIDRPWRMFKFQIQD